MEQNLPNTQIEEQNPQHISPTNQKQKPRPIEPLPKQPKPLDVRTKEAVAITKKGKFKKIVVVVGIVLGILVLASIGISIYKSRQINEPIVVQEVEEENRIVQIEDVDIKKMVRADSGTLKINLEYPEDAFIFEEDKNGIKKLEIIYALSTSEPGNIAETELEKGYVFRVSAFKTETRDLDQISLVKNSSFVANCAETAEISKVETGVVSTSESRTFDVINCNGDYRLTYVSKFGYFYEFMQFFKGDFGYKQRYRAATEDILRSIKFYPERETGPTETFSNEKYGFSFEYPSEYSAECCDITGAILDRSEKLIVLGNTESIIDQNTFDGFGIFIEKPSSVIGFDEYLELQRKTLIDDYVVVKGRAPEPEDVSVKVGEKDAVILKNYSWRGNDLIFVDISTENSSKVLIISVLNTSGDDFTEIFNTILRSFKFF